MYSRFTALKDYSEKHQQRLENSTAIVVGLGATGSAVAENLARHGVKLVLIDRDYLEQKDAYSSSLYTPQDCGSALPKVEAARKKLEKFTEVESHLESLGTDNAELLNTDVIMDGSDNIETRKLINDYSKKEEVPWIYTAALGRKGYSMVFGSACFNCLVQESGRVATCESEGIMRETAQRMAAVSSSKAVDLLTEKEVDGRLEFVSGRKMEVETEGCQVCRGENFPHLEAGEKVSRVCGEGKFQVEKKFDGKDLEKAVEVGEKLVENEYLVKLRYEDREIVFFRSGRVIVEAHDPGHAKATISELTGL